MQFCKKSNFKSKMTKYLSIMIIDYGIVKDFASISEAYLGCVQ